MCIPPISTEFGRVVREVNLGLPFETALENIVRRVRSDDLELMATAISIQYTVGGNLAEILDIDLDQQYEGVRPRETFLTICYYAEEFVQAALRAERAGTGESRR